TVTQLGCTPLFILADKPLMFVELLVKAAGLPPQEGLVCPTAFVTFTEKVQEPFAPTLPPLRAMVVLPATAVTVPLHEFTTPGTDATRRPLGKLSVKANPV
ncbi:MAG: hypothetical protein IPJ82_23535, partial [Lewinellaceae bacterium]|nr:hypothetical protein [Lewinellaceae bacterium]